MRGVLKSIHPWVVAGSILVVAVLHWAQAALVPVAPGIMNDSGDCNA